MPSFERGTVVRVPFPYTDRPVRQHRPALVVGLPGAADAPSLVWVLMITSAENRRWTDDVDADPGDPMTGLPVPSVIRVRKIATVETGRAEAIGKISAATLARVMTEVRRALDA